jgi:predicted choloylglycine hydrolase
MKAAAHMNFSFRAFAEDEPGAIWQQEFQQRWPAYRQWFLRFGDRDRPTYLESSRALKRYMPQIIPAYEHMVDLAGGGDRASRFLAQFCPPPLFRGCSQAVYLEDEPVLVRNYDYSPYIFDGLVMRSKLEQRAVLAMMDCMSGALDGINSDGLAVSMSFGGRQEFGIGFGIPMVLRYLLEYAGDVAEACDLLQRVPVNGAYNVMLLDRENRFETLAVAPGQEILRMGTRVSTNHQPGSSWPIYEEKVDTHLRYRHLDEISLAARLDTRQFSREFLRPPLYNTRFGRGFGTLYSAAFYPQSRTCEYLWPEHGWSFDFGEFENCEYEIDFIDPAGYPANSQTYGELYTSVPQPVLLY